MSKRCTPRPKVFTWVINFGLVRLATSKLITDRKSTRLNSSHTEIYTLSLHDALPILGVVRVHVEAVHAAPEGFHMGNQLRLGAVGHVEVDYRSEEHTSELQSHRDLHSFPTRRSSDLRRSARPCRSGARRARRFSHG